MVVSYSFCSIDFFFIIYIYIFYHSPIVLSIVRPYHVVPDSEARARALSVTARAHKIAPAAVREAALDCQVS